MKVTFCVWLWLLIVPAMAQSVFRIDSLPANGILLDKGWKWHAGDNANWAKPDFDDSKWEGIDPTKDVMDLPQVRQAGIGWFRLRLTINQSVRMESLALLIQQTGASNVYANGRLLHRFGQIDKSGRAAQAYDPRGQPISFSIGNDSLQTLAIRFAFANDVWYTTSSAPRNMNVCLRIIVNGVTNAVRFHQVYYRDISALDYLKTGIFFILTVLHFAFYFYYPVQRANFYFSLFSLCSLLAYLLQAQTTEIHQVASLQAVQIAIGILTALFQLLLFTALYSLFKRPLGLLYWFLFAYFFVCIPLTVWPYRWGLVYGQNLFFFLCLLESIRITILAVRQKKRGSRIVMRGVVVSLVFLVIYAALLPFQGAFLAQLYTSNNIVYFGLIHLPYNISFLSIPVAISLYLGLEFAFANKTLESKLVEIEKLSAYTLAQEQEKQQLLTTENDRLEQQVKVRTAELRQSLDNLKATQTQLIQREKMASLGELTAGIAHEIQNPLNFVNNFSEVSAELASELKEEAQAGHLEDVLAIADDLTQNLDKITLHGRRASAIVKGMLEHSRTSTGERQPTDLNTLTDEYLRLAYQGQRAKDKAFNAELKTDFEPDLGKVEVVPQDIGRVLLNLYNNAFYAVGQKQKTAPSDYQPTVTVSTRLISSSPERAQVTHPAGVEIRIKDNGTGIPESVKAKIFQPFFTTKPTGEGTGLGLSLSYDIITKGHGGTLAVESQEGEGSEFIVTLPLGLQ